MTYPSSFNRHDAKKVIHPAKIVPTGTLAKAISSKLRCGRVFATRTTNAHRQVNNHQLTPGRKGQTESI